MNGYSRIRKGNTTRSKSVDFSFLPQTPQSGPTYALKSLKSQPDDPPIPEHEHEDDIGEIFGVILGIKCPVYSKNSVKDPVEEQNMALQSVMKRTLSIRRSESEGYCRIHHQCNITAADEYTTISASKTRFTKKKGKILKACKHVFGF
ncbi:unnamed protein product [Fraxinus pennsylvanica]|uniref:Uncharacterized protein n=1 Tax=Fraxinus pennsylvanica TaxID=56036 RepID=A0AAD1ZYY9_9LAMI|nr:unnamed protein product [Fraxinus pennsylvanica]